MFDRSVSTLGHRTPLRDHSRISGVLVLSLSELSCLFEGWMRVNWLVAFGQMSFCECFCWSSSVSVHSPSTTVRFSWSFGGSTRVNRVVAFGNVSFRPANSLVHAAFVPFVSHSDGVSLIPHRIVADKSAHPVLSIPVWSPRNRLVAPFWSLHGGWICLGNHPLAPHREFQSNQIPLKTLEFLRLRYISRNLLK